VAFVDLNADLGEGVTDDEALLAIVTSANVACGYHAGDAATMRAVCAEAVRVGVAVGAQVSYDDRANFGRVALDVTYDVLRAQVADQVATLSAIAAEAGTRVSYVKPHGALYHRVVDDEEQARAVLDGSADLPVLGFPGAVILRLAHHRATFREGFPDRGYTAEGRLVPRGQPGALVEEVEQIAANAVRHAAAVDSVCVHGDSPSAVAAAAACRRALTEHGYVLRSFA
jgi:UPF0271 protein